VKKTDRSAYCKKSFVINKHSVSYHQSINQSILLLQHRPVSVAVAIERCPQWCLAEWLRDGAKDAVLVHITTVTDVRWVRREHDLLATSAE